jgi:putative ABC transport system permease protein
MLGTLFRDIVHALRITAKTPGVSIIAVLSLALGVALNVSIFSIVNSWLLRPLPYPDAERLIMVYENNRNNPDLFNSVSPANFFDWQERAQTLEGWFAVNYNILSLTGVDQPQQLLVGYVTPNYLEEIGAEAMIGRTFQLDEGGADDDRVAVMKESVWRNQYGADPEMIGRTIILNGEPHTVVGVLPETFDSLLGTVALWIASDLEGQREERGARSLGVTARLTPGATLDQAQAEMSSLAADMEQRYPETNRDWGITLRTVREMFPGPTDRMLIQILMLVMVLALLIACTNVSNLLLAKADARSKEMAIRTALGASRGRLVSQLLVESVMLALLAGVLGMLLSIWGVRGIAQALPAEIPGYFSPSIDGAVVSFGILLSVLAGLTFGITPAMQAVGSNASSALTEGGRGGTASRRRRRFRNSFVAAEFAMALTILIGAAVLTDLFDEALDVNPGYDASGVLTLEFTLQDHTYPERADMALALEQIGQRLDEISGITTWAFANQMPRAFNLPESTFTIEGQPVEENREPRASWLTVTPAYLEVLRIPLLRGRFIAESDRLDAPLVILVSQRLAERFFDGRDPVGERLTVQGEPREIVGVVSDVAQERLAGLQPIEPTVYFPMAQRPTRVTRAFLRGPADPQELARPVQEAIWLVDPEQPITAVRTLEEFIETQLAGPDVLVKLLYLVGSLTLALAAVGIYGVMAYSVSQQTKEIGIRMALGAAPRQVLARMTKQGARLAAVGLLVGTPAAWAVGRLILGIPSTIPGGLVLEIDVSATPIIVVSIILASVGLVASYLPARRATRIDPIVAIRED